MPVADCVGAEVSDVKPKTTGGFYREDAARLASEAARGPGPAGEAPRPAIRPIVAIPTVEPDAPERPRLRPRPASNQNLRTPRLDGYDKPPERRAWSVGRIIAWVLLAPWYAATAIGAIGVDLMFLKDMLGF